MQQSSRAEAERLRTALQYHAAVAEVARTEWTQFKPARIAAGLALQAIAAALAVATCALLLSKRQSCFAEIITIQRRFQGQAVPELASHGTDWAPLLTAAGLIAVRASIPFSNSLILGELQATTLLMAVAVVLAGGAALSRLMAHVRSCGAHMYGTLFAALSAWEQLQLVWLLVQDAILRRRALEMRAPPEATDAFPEPEHVDNAPYQRMRWRPVLIAVGMAGTSLLMPRTAGLRYGAWALHTTALLLLMRMMWLFLKTKRVFRGTRDQAWLCMLPRGTVRNTLQLAGLVGTALASVYALAQLGGIDRIGANPFHKAPGTDDSTQTTAVSSGRALQPWLILLPVLALCSLLSFQLDALSRRITTQPGTVQRFGAHVPWRRVLGDALIAAAASGSVARVLLPPWRWLRALVELDIEDDNAQVWEALDHFGAGFSVRRLCGEADVW